MNTTDKIMARIDASVDASDERLGRLAKNYREAAKSEIEVLVRDVERYQKLKTLDWYVGPASFYCDEAGGMNDYEDHNGDGLDSAIDAAMQEKQS